MWAKLLRNRMVSPVTGPLYKEVVLSRWSGNGVTTDKSRKTQSWYRQKRPWDRILPYTMTYTSIQQFRTCSTVGWASVSAGKASDATWADPEVMGVYNKAYSNLLSKIKSTEAELGAALAEYRKTADMVSDRVTQLWKFTRAVRRGRLGDAYDILRIPPGYRSKQRSFSGAFLELSFGWVPVVSDIHNGMKILCNGVPPWIFARARSSGPLAPFTVTQGSHPTVTVLKRLSGNVKVQVGCTITVSNPNLWLLNQLGLINPASVAWETVPFSFVVDYFVNVGDVINGWSDFIGLSLRDAYRTFVVERLDSRYAEFGSISDPSSPCFGSTGGQIPNVSWNYLEEFSAKMERSWGIPGPSLRLTAPRVSLSRASTSIALLLQQLKGR